MSDHNEWTPVVLRKNPTKPPTSGAALARAKANGQIETVSKVAHTAPANARKLDENELDSYRHQTVTQDFKLALQKARQAKNLTQAQLAQKLNLQASIITSYENGKAIPDGQVISKLNRELGVTLPKIPKKKPAVDA